MRKYRKLQDPKSTPSLRCPIEPTMFSRPIPNGAAAGFINNRLALHLGLPFGISIIAVGLPQIAATLGTSVFNTEGTHAKAVGSIIMAGLTCRLYYSTEEAFSKFTNHNGDDSHAL